MAAGIDPKTAISEAAPPTESIANGPRENATLTMAATNKGIRSWCLKTRAMLNQMPETPHLSPTERQMVASNLAAAASSAKRGLGVEVCWHCEGEGCNWCRETGYITDTDRGSIPLKGQV